MNRVRRTRLLAGGLAVALAIGAMTATSTVPAYAVDDPNDPGFVTMRANWRWTLDGGASNPSDPATAAAINDRTTTAQAALDSMDTTANRTYLWPELVTTPTQDQATAVGLSYQRLEKMAVAFRTNGSSLRNDPTLKSAILGGLDFLYTTAYNTTTSPTGNWWWNSVGSAIALLNTTILMWDHLPAATRALYAQSVAKAGGTGGGCNANARGPNAIWFCIVQLQRGMVAGHEPDVSNAKTHILTTIKTDNLVVGEGFLPDGSITTHGFSYNGGYGVPAVEFLAAAIHAFDASSFDYTTAQTEPLFNSIFDFYRPFLFEGAMVSGVRGRDISRSVSGDHVMGARTLAALATLAKEAPEPQRSTMRAFITSQVKSSSHDVYAGLPVSSIRDLQAALVTPVPAADSSSAVFPYSDRVMHARPGWTYALSMYSSRIYNFETALGENTRGWFTGDGAGFVYNGDGTQTDGAFWPTVDSNYLPGTLVMDKTRTDGRKLGLAWVGGTTLRSGTDAYTAAGMDYAPQIRLQSTGALQPQLTAKKSWFLFDDEVAVLEAGVTSPSTNTLRSVIENRRISPAGTESLTVTTASGTTALSSTTMNQTFHGVQSIHLAGRGEGDAMGYVFTDAPASIFGYRNAYSGRWGSINANQAQNPPGDPLLTERYQLLTRPYPSQPANQSFSYVLLPGAQAAQVDDYRTAPDTVTLANNSSVQAVEEQTLGIVAANFWADQPTAVDRAGVAWLTSDKKASVMVRVTGTTVEVSVADPTQLNTGTVSIGVSVPVMSRTSGDPRIALTSAPGQNLTFMVDVSGTKGAPVTAVFQR